MKLAKYTHELLLGLILVAVLLSASGMSFAHERGGDYRYYQSFTEKLASGEVDLSIPGFHGSDFVGAAWYAVYKSPTSHLEYLMLAGLLIPHAAYLAAFALFRNKKHGLLFAGIVALMPYMTFSYITGYTQAANIFFFLLTIYGAVKHKWWTGLTWAIAITTKPFAVILLPLILLYAKGDRPVAKYKHILVGLGLPAIYVIAQYLQTGEVLVGVHGNTESLVVWNDGAAKVISNAAWGIQSMFSVHNYYYADPGITGHWNLLHTTPVLMFLGLFGLLWPKQFFKDNAGLHISLLLGALLGFTMNAVVSMDNFYMQFFALMMILGALPVLVQQPLWILIVLATLHYQWFYFYLDFKTDASLEVLAFAVPLALDFFLLSWCLLHIKQLTRYLETVFFRN